MGRHRQPGWLHASLEPLATPGADSGAKPWLATSWVANTDFTRWVINLRTGVQFQDGTPFNAQAVVDNIKADLKSPFYTLTVASLFKGVESTERHAGGGRFQSALGGLPQLIPGRRLRP